MLEDDAEMVLVHEVAEHANTVRLAVGICDVELLEHRQLLLGLSQPVVSRAISTLLRIILFSKHELVVADNLHSNFLVWVLEVARSNDVAEHTLTSVPKDLEPAIQHFSNLNLCNET